MMALSNLQEEKKETVLKYTTCDGNVWFKAYIKLDPGVYYSQFWLAGFGVWYFASFTQVKYRIRGQLCQKLLLAKV